MTEAIIRAYSDLLYPAHPFPEMHPNQIAVMGTLFGMQPAPPERCRMLELGCGAGGSLIPFAMVLPESSFLGVDITEKAITQAQQTAKELGLRNVEFRCADILEMPEACGPFDYIGAHGVYSWVPPVVREKILALCAASLAPHGIAYISYNARPGSDLRRMHREMMLFHTQSAETPAERVQQARLFTEFLAAAKEGNEIYNTVCNWNRERIAKLPDPLVFHDDLGTFNEPFFFLDFVRAAAAHNLQYVSESDLSSMSERRFEPAMRQKLAEMGSNVFAAEQYMDFLSGRSFRETLLCHANVPLQRKLDPRSVAGMSFTSQLTPVAEQPDIAGAAEEEFRAAKGRSIRTSHPLAKAILFELGKVFPAALAFEELREGVEKHLGPTDRLTLANGILETYASGPLLALHIAPPKCAAAVSQRPVLSPLARIQVAAGAPVMTNLNCHVIDVGDALLRKLLLLLDGQHDRAALVQELAAAIRAGAIPAPANMTPGRALEEELAEGVEQQLQMARRFALLVS